MLRLKKILHVGKYVVLVSAQHCLKGLKGVNQQPKRSQDNRQV